MDAKKDEIDRLIGRSLLTAEAMFSSLRDRIVEEVAANYLTATGSELNALVWDLLVAFEPVAVQMLSDVELASWVSGNWTVERAIPNTLIGVVGNTPQVSGGVDLAGRVISFPQIEQAAESMLERGLLLRPEFDALEAEARRKAFTVAQVDSVETLDRVRNLVAEAIDDGTGLEEFRETLAESLETSRLGSAHVENVYRTNIQSAFHDGHDRLAEDPTVSELFPYQEYLPISDGRVRPEHLALGSLGIDGTGVYRKEDPFWQVFRPPWGYQCRCGINLLTISRAARKGVQEAIEWQRTGIKPPLQSRLPDIPFRPDPSFA